jgi:hypothetical protein
MDDCFERSITLYSLVESSNLCNILNDGEIELLLWSVWVCCLNLICLLLRSDCSYDGVTMFE